MAVRERYSTEDSISCFECGTTENSVGDPLQSIGQHLPMHDIRLSAYLKKHPEAFTHSALFRLHRQEVAELTVTQKWEDVLTALNNDGFLSVSDLAEFLDTTRSSVNAIISQESTKPNGQARLQPDGLGMMVDEETGEIGKHFYLFSIRTALQFKRTMRRKPKSRA